MNVWKLEQLLAMALDLESSSPETKDQLAIRTQWFNRKAQVPLCAMQHLNAPRRACPLLHCANNQKWFRIFLILSGPTIGRD